MKKENIEGGRRVAKNDGDRMFTLLDIHRKFRISRNFSTSECDEAPEKIGVKLARDVFRKVFPTGQT